MNHTIVVVSDNEMKVTTINKRWIKQMEKLAKDKHVEELEPEDDEVGRVFIGDAKLVTLPYYRRPREYTEEQREAARAHMARVRAKRATETKPKTKPKAKPKTKRGVAKE